MSRIFFVATKVVLRNDFWSEIEENVECDYQDINDLDFIDSYVTKEVPKPQLINNILLILSWVKNELPNLNDALEVKNKLKKLHTTLKVEPELILNGKVLPIFC